MGEGEESIEEHAVVQSVLLAAAAAVAEEDRSRWREGAASTGRTREEH